MNDWWNDPPDPPEPPPCPSCEEGTGTWLHSGFHPLLSRPVDVFACDSCGYQWSTLADVDPEPEDFDDFDDESPEQAVCPHGNDPAECDACFRESDLAYDARRERWKT